MKTYQSIINSISALENVKALYEVLKANGISYKKASSFRKFTINSHYSMGETTILTIGKQKTFVFTENTKDTYSNSCSFTPTYGKIVVNFSKKALKEYIELCTTNDEEALRSFILTYITSYRTSRDRDITLEDINLIK